jgi:hypothetical protein
MGLIIHMESKMNLTLDTCTTALNCAAINHKAAIQLELAVGLAVFHMFKGTNKDARKMLVQAYSLAGWQCQKFSDPDYKTVNRRINATASLYEKVPVEKWIGSLEEMDIIQAICEGLEPYQLYTIQDVLRYAAPHRVQDKKLAVEPAHDVLDGPAVNNHTGQDRVMQQFRRASDHLEEGSKLVNTDHISVVIPKGTPRSEVLELARQLLLFAEENKEKELLTV